jgi:hypothetical protein
MTNEQFALMVRENVLDRIFPEIQETIISAIRDQTEAMTRLLRHPEQIQAGEIANVVKKHLNPSLNAMSEGLLRLATSVEVALKAPPHSSLGSLAHEVSPTYELIKDTRNAIRLLGSRIANGLEYLYKVGFSIMESLSREQRIEAEHERAVRKYLKNIKVVTDLVMITIETEEPESHSFTKALVRYMSLAKSAQAEFEAHFASQTEPLQQPVQGPHEQDGTPPSPSNTFYLPSNDIHGNPHDERGVDETYSEAMDRYSSQLNDAVIASHDDPPEHMNAEVGAELKDPPEQVYPSLMMTAECVPVQQIPETEEQLVVVATMASQGQIIIAEPVGDRAMKVMRKRSRSKLQRP